MVTGGDGDFLDLLEWPDAAAAAVMGVFEADEFGGGKVMIAGAQGVLDIVGGEDAAFAGEETGHDAGECGGSA